MTDQIKPGHYSIERNRWTEQEVDAIQQMINIAIDKH